MLFTTFCIILPDFCLVLHIYAHEYSEGMKEMNGYEYQVDSFLKSNHNSQL